MATMTQIMTWAKDNLDANQYKQCKEAFASDYPDLWREWLDKYDNANRSKHNYEMSCTPNEYMTMIKQAPHGSNHRKLQILSERRSKSKMSKRKILVFSYTYNNEIYRTRAVLG